MIRTIEEIRAFYRTATDKAAAIKRLALDEGKSEKLILCYVRPYEAPAKSKETPATAFKIDTAVKVEKPKVEKPLKAKETLPHRTTNLKQNKIDREIKQRELYDQGKTDGQIGAACGMATQLVYLWRKKNNLPTRWLQPDQVVQPAVPEDRIFGNLRPNYGDVAKIMKPDAIKVAEPVIETPKSVISEPDPVIKPRATDEMIEDHVIHGSIFERLQEMAEKSIHPATLDESKPPIGIMPRWLWEEKRRDELIKAITRCLEARHPILAEWVEEYNERCGK